MKKILYILAREDGSVLEFIKTDEDFNSVYENTVGCNNGEILLEIEPKQIEELKKLLEGGE